MCSQNLVNLLTEVVDEFVRDNKMFTAFDVTMEARKRTTYMIQHWEAKKEVHSMMRSYIAQGSFLSTVADLGMNPNPILYYPHGADPSEYTGNACTATVQTTDDDDVSTSSQCQVPLGKPDCRGRICVPSAFVRQLKNVDSVYVYVFPDDVSGNVTIFSNRPALFGDDCYEYVVDRDDNIRISRSVLEKAHLGGKNCKFEVDSNKIVIKEA